MEEREEWQDGESHLLTFQSCSRITFHALRFMFHLT